MNYIVLDLEWNQSPDGKGGENSGIPFEILEIGAVKLDENRQIRDTYHQLICPNIYQELHFHTKELLHFDMDELRRDGVPFGQAVLEFFSWCGEDFRFCTWGTMDLTELQRNLKYYHILQLMQFPVFYFDVQKIYAIRSGNRKDRKSLEHVIDELCIDKDQEFHRALEDAHYTALILQQVDERCMLENSSVDYYQHPADREDELYLSYPGYNKYVSRLFKSKEEALRDKAVTGSRCYLCGRPTKKVIRWFSGAGNKYYCVVHCAEHGDIKGKIRLKRTEEGKIYVVKTFKAADESAVDEVKRKQEMIRLKRMRRRRRG